MDSIVIITGYERVAAGRRDAYVAGFRDLVSAARACDDCIHVAITADSIDPERINNTEVWRSAAALDRWRAQAPVPDVDVEILVQEVHRTVPPTVARCSDFPHDDFRPDPVNTDRSTSPIPRRHP